jgi:Hemerythrin HHE cation binding domain
MWTPPLPSTRGELFRSLPKERQSPSIRQPRRHASEYQRFVAVRTGYLATLQRTRQKRQVMINDPVRILKADHREGEKLLAKLGDSDEGSEREQLLDELATNLTAHMEAEDSIVYPAVKQAVGAEDEEEAEIGHGLAREGLDKLRAMVAMPGFGAAVEMLKGGIAHHVHEEEHELLPELKDRLSRDEWLALGDQLIEAKKAAGLPIAKAPTSLDQADQGQEQRIQVGH